MQIIIFFRMAVLSHADMIFFSNGSSRPCRYDFFRKYKKKLKKDFHNYDFLMAVLGHYTEHNW